MSGSLFTGAGALLVTTLLCSAHPVAAQDAYELTEDDQWTIQEQVDPTSPQGRLNAITHALAAEEFERAENLATQWIARFANHPLAPEAYVARGDALLGQKEHYKALFDYEYVARSFPGSEAFVTALERELHVGNLFLTGTKRKMFGIRVFDATQEGQELLIRVQERMPGSQVAERAGLALSEYYFRERKMDLAAESYDLFIENYPNSPHVDTASRRLIYAHLASFKGPAFDAKGLYEARARLRAMQRQNPSLAQQIGADALLHRIDESDARKQLEAAKWYLNRKNIISAELTIRRMIEQYPQSVAARQGVRLGVKLLPQLPPSIRDNTLKYDELAALIDEVVEATADADAHAETRVDGPAERRPADAAGSGVPASEAEETSG